MPAITVEDDSRELHQHEFMVLADSYVLGEGLMDNTFKDVAIDALCVKVRGPRGDTIWPAFVGMVKIIYAGTPESSKARALLVNIFQYHVLSARK